VTTIAFSATSANYIRKFTGTELLPVAPAKGAPPTEDYVYKLWGGVLAVSAASAVVTGTNTAKVVAMLAATVCSFLVGSLPTFKAKMNPIVTTSVLSNVAAAVLGAMTGDSWMKMLSLYRTGVPFGLETISGLGAGDILMTFLGSVILSFAFKVFEARKVIARHAVEIFGCLISTSMFAMFSTAIAAKSLGLSSALSAALVPRSVTVALAIPVTTLLGHPEMVSVTAAGVVLTGLIGSSLAVAVLNKVGAKDPITRGLATAASAHGLGTAALAGSEPEALPYCALAYALSGIISSVLVAVPFIQAALIGIIGA
jgi:putative effector of murein hydrolase